VTKTGKCETAQELQNIEGYIILAYIDPEEYERERADGIEHGDTVNSAVIPDECTMAVIGEATQADWERQCDLCGETYCDLWERPYIGFLKVCAE
jgi:hypothetical protein